ncbi:MAG: phosphopantetheine-binding protein [Usitatibacter sp.]
MTTLERLQALLEKDFDIAPGRLAGETRLEDLDIDSLRMIEILFEVEDAFAISVPASEAELRSRLVTVGDLVAYIDSLIAQKAAAP